MKKDCLEKLILTGHIEGKWETASNLPNIIISKEKYLTVCMKYLKSERV